jgi:hypothetical protein
MGFGFDVKTYERNHVSDKTIESIEENVYKHVDDLKAFGSYGDNEGMNKRAVELELTFKYWLMGIQGIIPDDFKKVMKN